MEEEKESRPRLKFCPPPPPPGEAREGREEKRSKGHCRINRQRYFPKSKHRGGGRQTDSPPLPFFSSNVDCERISTTRNTVSHVLSLVYPPPHPLLSAIKARRRRWWRREVRTLRPWSGPDCSAAFPLSRTCLPCLLRKSCCPWAQGREYRQVPNGSPRGNYLDS